MSLLSIFSSQCENFSNELLKIYPKDTYFKMASNGISLLKKSNPRKLVELFHYYIIPYKTNILERDEN